MVVAEALAALIDSAGYALGPRLWFRMGAIRCAMEHDVVYTLEKESDELAVSAFEPLREMVEVVAQVLGEPTPTAPRVHYLRAVAPGTDWRWTRSVDENTLVRVIFVTFSPELGIMPSTWRYRSSPISKNDEARRDIQTFR